MSVEEVEVEVGASPAAVVVVAAGQAAQEQAAQHQGADVEPAARAPPAGAPRRAAAEVLPPVVSC